MSQKGLCGLTNAFVTCENSFRGRVCEAPTLFFVTVYESTGDVGADDSIRHM